MFRFLLAGMKDIEVRQFLRLRSEVFHTEKLSGPNSQHSTLTEGLKWKERQQRWKDTKYGYVPFAKHERVTFMNDKVFPAFLKCQFRLANNQKDFVKKYHQEGRRQYELWKKIEQDDEKLQNICNDTNPAAVGRCLQHDYQLKVKDLGILSSNLQSLEKLSTELSGKIDALLKEDDELFGKVTNKLKPGTECAHTFHEKCITRIDGLIKKTSEVTDKVKSLEQKHQQMYKLKWKTVKEGKSKSRTRKQRRLEANVNKILSAISPGYSLTGPVETLDVSQVQLLSLRQETWIRFLLNSKRMTESAEYQFMEHLKPAVKEALGKKSSSSECYSSDHESDTKGWKC